MVAFCFNEVRQKQISILHSPKVQPTGNHSVAIICQSLTRMPPVISLPMFASANSSLTAYKDAVQKLASVPIFELRVFAEQKRRHGCSQLTAVMGNVRVAHYLASFHKNAVFVKTRYCFICPPSLAEMDCVQGWTRYKSSRCLYANCVPCTVSVQTRV